MSVLPGEEPHEQGGAIHVNRDNLRLEAIREDIAALRRRATCRWRALSLENYTDDGRYAVESLAELRRCGLPSRTPATTTRRRIGRHDSTRKQRPQRARRRSPRGDLLRPRYKPERPTKNTRSESPRREGRCHDKGWGLAIASAWITSDFEGDLTSVRLQGASILEVVVEDHEVVRLLVVVYEAIMLSEKRQHLGMAMVVHRAAATGLPPFAASIASNKVKPWPARCARSLT